MFVLICGNCAFARGVSWLDMPTHNLILHVWKGCIGRERGLSLAAPPSVRGKFEVASSAFITKHQGTKYHPELVPQYQSPRCHADRHLHGQRYDRLTMLQVVLCRSEKEEQRNGNEREDDIEKEKR